MQQLLSLLFCFLLLLLLLLLLVILLFAVALRFSGAPIRSDEASGQNP
jgi:hypothetical protein